MNPDRDLTRLETRLAKAREVLRWPDERLYVRVDAVSAWSPAEHVDHLVRSLDLALGAIQVLQQGEDERIGPGGSPSLTGRAVLWLGWIPRGRAEAPPEARPEPIPVRQRLRDGLFGVRDRAATVHAAAGTLSRIPGTLPHPALGALRAAHWSRFADVHTGHHLAIIADIDRRRAIGELASSPLLGEEGEYGAGAEAR